MELCDQPLLHMLSRKDPKFRREPCLGNIFREVFLGLRYCHSKGIVHRDVKPSNILVAPSGYVKIANFKCSTLMARKGLCDRVGTIPYMSPEMLQGKRYDYKTDIWSCGATAYLLFYGAYPYQLPRSSDASTLCNPKIEKREVNIVKQAFAIATHTPPPTFEAIPSFPQPSGYAEIFVRTLLDRDDIHRPDADERLELTTELLFQVSHNMQEQETSKDSFEAVVQLVENEKFHLKVPFPVGAECSSLLTWAQQLQSPEETKTLAAESASTGTPSTMELTETMSLDSPANDEVSLLSEDDLVHRVLL